MEDAWDWVQEELKKIQDDMPMDSEMVQVVDAISVADFWKRRYDEEQLLWEKKVEVREDEKRLLQGKAQQHEMAIKELDFRFKELERRWQQEKLLLEDRLKAKDIEAALAQKESKLENKLKAIEDENRELKSEMGRLIGAPVAPAGRPVALPVTPGADTGRLPETLVHRDEEALKRLEKLEAEKAEVARALAEKEKAFVAEKEQWERAEKEVHQVSGQMSRQLANLKEREEEHFVILEDLARGFAHRVRNYLGIMSGTIQLAMTNYKMEPELEEQLKVVDDSVQNMLKSIEDFLSLARIPEMNLVPIDLQGLLENVAAGFEQRMRAQGVTLNTSFAANIPLFNGDQKMFNDAFQNLVENAVEAMPQGGHLSITTECDTEAKRITIKIVDTGAGISETHLKKVFQPYFSSKKNRKGLGLTIAKRVVDLHRGTLLLDSGKGKGTVVTVNLYEESAD